jgi:hypothetical protein
VTAGCDGHAESLIFCFPEIRLPRYRLRMTDRPESDLAMAVDTSPKGVESSLSSVNGSPD